MDELTLNRIASQLGAALVNQILLQARVDALQSENDQLKAQLASWQDTKPKPPELV